ncbi:hypothetical protein HZS_2404, partial [Henneguya salminicola]
VLKEYQPIHNLFNIFYKKYDSQHAKFKNKCLNFLKQYVNLQSIKYQKINTLFQNFSEKQETLTELKKLCGTIKFKIIVENNKQEENNQKLKRPIKKNRDPPFNKKFSARVPKKNDKNEKKQGIKKIKKQ